MSKAKPSSNNNLVQQLCVLLADTYALALKTQNYHWNVTGVEFYSLHKLFEEQYEALHEAADVLAERIRALNAYAPGSFSEFSKLTCVTEAKKNLNSKAMLEDLIESNIAVVVQGKKTIEACEKANDDATMDIVVTRLEDHEKYAWMLRSSIK